MKQDNILFPFIGFVIGIIPYLLIILIIKEETLSNILSIVGLFTAFINAYIFYIKTKNLN